MKISIFGLGYVGAVSAACFAELGHQVLGVEIDHKKVAMINAGVAPIVEPDLQERIAAVTASGRLYATTDGRQAVLDSDISLICVGTPTSDGGIVALDALEGVAAEIGNTLRAKQAPHIVVVRSTVPPGTTAARLAPVLQATSGRKLGDGIELCCNPEFLREGCALHDFYHPPFTVLGSLRGTVPPLLIELYRDIAAPMFCTWCAVAESVKMVSNSFHALKIAFANEIGALLKTNGIDGRQVMEVFCQDRKLNVSAAYLRPGFAFGGSCLPKDIRALVHLGSYSEVRTPLLDRILASNEAHIERAFRLITENGRCVVALFGIAFKLGTDDLRESPLVAISERLVGKGYHLRIYDPHVEMSRLTGRNLAFIEREIPHLGAMMVRSAEAALEGADVIVIGHAEATDIRAIVANHANRVVIDLQGVNAPELVRSPNYRGICW